ncbi:hypothetical protein HNR62_002261 [Oceanisphaera litoralis]|uniref:hypothetical protein n=1 Tax=Oceanisphaera litoralis TaxID=225144 RepID=UPI00195A8AF7|nr:hypothetical protein [Oceanisphaera litoralis]MBM7456375.1 hypothetical protein [Oceanisphaera litoralis]
MPSITPEQLPELMFALTTTNINLQTRRLIEWRVHTIARPDEAADARWEEIEHGG